MNLRVRREVLIESGRQVLLIWVALCHILRSWMILRCLNDFGWHSLAWAYSQGSSMSLSRGGSLENFLRPRLRTSMLPWTLCSTEQSGVQAKVKGWEDRLYSLLRESAKSAWQQRQCIGDSNLSTKISGRENSLLSIMLTKSFELSFKVWVCHAEKRRKIIWVDGKRVSKARNCKSTSHLQGGEAVLQTEWRVQGPQGPRVNLER